ncbi:hypothetical protein K435DRAFT_11492 [Dendrothele bispora CBS 962.96]|uniref:Uncharacterized protein n=1 Tax=Dendrothele bispora (strain CBS 962.96) TaxID=1314807 RepID=A0A4S8MZ78_DENBC|nr:hypothetical protein K435DRAFT_11492 [Dendrothele bispora CBS 962.96]
MFRPRNPYYLRISEKNVLLVYLYLDDRHLEWMSDRILQHVLEDLRPNILSKLQEETGSKKRGVDTHRGDSYQFCYFLRKTQPHSLVFKNRTFTTEPRPPQAPIRNSSSKRKAFAPAKNSRKKQKTKKKKSKAAARDSDSDPFVSSEDEEDVAGENEGTGDAPTSIDDDDDPMDDDDVNLVTSNDRGRTIKTVEFSFEVDEEEEKPKPVLHLQYRGFDILGQCLCIVVEPWPPIRAPTRAPSVFRAPSRAPTIAPPSFATAAQAEASARGRGQTPLFLPDIDEREGSEAPFSFRDRASTLPPVPLFNDSELDNDEYGGMMEFSHVLNATGDERARPVDDDQDMEGEVFFGDADEFKEL